MCCTFLGNAGDFTTVILIIIAVKIFIIIVKALFDRKVKIFRKKKVEKFSKVQRVDKSSERTVNIKLSKLSNPRSTRSSRNNNIKAKHADGLKKSLSMSGSVGQIKSYSKKPSFAGAPSKMAKRSMTWGFEGDRISFKNRKKNQNTAIAKIYKLVDTLSKFLKLGHLVLLMRMALVDFMIPVSINIYFLYGFTFGIGLNWTFCILILALYGILLFYGFTVMKNTDIFLVKKSENPQFELSNAEKSQVARFKNWMTSRFNLKEELKFPYKYVPEIIALGEFISCLSLVIFNSHFLLQIAPLFLLKLTLVWFHFAKKNMYTDKMEYFTNLVNELLLLLVSVVFIVYYFVYTKIGAQG